MIMSTPIRNKNGSLSIYGFVCGYIQHASSTGKEWEGVYLRLYLDGVWHVQVSGLSTDTGKDWFCFDNLGDARKKYKALKRKYKLLEV